MPLRFVSVEKEHPFQGRTERWSNVYCFDMTDVSLSSHEAIQDAVVAAERPVHRSTVKFVRSRVFTTRNLNGITDSGDMYSVMERNVFGTGPNTVGLPYVECAVLVKWPLTRMTKIGGGLGRQRSLKKWIRAVGAGDFSDTVKTGVDALGSTNKTAYQTYAAAIEGIANSNLVSPGDSAQPTGPAIVHPYLEHRQFPRGRKEGVL